MSEDFGLKDTMPLGKYADWLIGDVIQFDPSYIKGMVESTSWFILDGEAQQVLEMYCCEDE